MPNTQKLPKEVEKRFDKEFKYLMTVPIYPKDVFMSEGEKTFNDEVKDFLAKELALQKQELLKRVRKMDWWGKLCIQDSNGNFVTCGQEVLDDLENVLEREEI